jgi:hypothetical protein
MLICSVMLQNSSGCRVTRMVNSTVTLSHVATAFAQEAKQSRGGPSASLRDQGAVRRYQVEIKVTASC